MIDNARDASARQFKSLEEFDREYFPTSSGREGTRDDTSRKLVARLVRLVSGHVQDAAPRAKKLS